MFGYHNKVEQQRTLPEILLRNPIFLSKTSSGVAIKVHWKENKLNRGIKEKNKNKKKGGKRRTKENFFSY